MTAVARRSLPAPIALAALALVAACAPAVTGVEVEVTFDPSLAVDQLVFTLSADGAAAVDPVKAPAEPTLLTSGDESAGFIVPDDMAGKSVTVSVEADDNGVPVARGSAKVLTKAGDIVTVVVDAARIAGCGDGVVDAPEACDDGNTGADDGCDGACEVELGWDCAGEPSVCQRCGDGITEGTEGCDDANFDDGDGCSACHVDDGFTCDTGAVPSVCAPPCGDGIIGGAETCDDGGNDDGDGCSSACAVEAGWTCDGAEPTTCTPVCGDGLVVGGEACDDGGTDDGDGCSSACTVEGGFACVTDDGAAPQSTCAPVCGDGLVRGGEECDDGADAATGNSDTRPNACRTDCTGPRCGDGVTDDTLGEECDDNDANTDNADGCLTGCRLPSCGDGFLEGGEACDDGNGADLDGCSSSCAVEGGSTCGGAPSFCVPSARAHSVGAGGDFATVGAAVASAAVLDGDTLFLASQRFDEGTVDVASKDLAIVGVPGTVIGFAGGNGETIRITNGSDVLLQGVAVEDDSNNRSAIRVEDAGTSLTIVGCTIGPSRNLGVDARAGTNVVIRRSLVTQNSGGGMSIAGSFTVENTVVRDNGSAGVTLAGAGTLRFDTVTANQGGGVTCGAATEVTSSIVFGNGGAQVSSGCDASTSDTGQEPLFEADGVHVAAGSPVVDAGGGDCPALDFDGDARPINGACDAGADERP